MMKYFRDNRTSFNEKMGDSMRDMSLDSEEDSKSAAEQPSFLAPDAASLRPRSRSRDDDYEVHAEMKEADDVHGEGVNKDTNAFIQLMKNTNANAGKKDLTESDESVNIVSLNQLILMFPVVERGFTLLRVEFERAATDYVPNPEEEVQAIARDLPRMASNDVIQDDVPIRTHVKLVEPGLALLLRNLRLDFKAVDVQLIMTSKEVGYRDQRESNVAETISFVQLATNAAFHKLVAMRAEQLKNERGLANMTETSTTQRIRKKRAADAQHAELLNGIWRACAILNDSFDLLDKRRKGVLTINEFKSAIGGEQGLSDVLVKLMAGKPAVRRVDFLLCMLQYGDIVEDWELEHNDSAAVTAQRQSLMLDNILEAFADSGAKHRSRGMPFVDDFKSALASARVASPGPAADGASSSIVPGCDP